MLREWSDRVPPCPPKPLLRRSEFWLGVFVVTGNLALAAGIAVWLLG